MDPLAELLARLDGDIADLTDDELTEARQAINAYGIQLRDQADVDDVDQLIQDAQALAAARDDIDTELERRATLATEATTARDEAFASFTDGDSTEDAEETEEPEVVEEPVVAARPSLADIAARRPVTAEPEPEPAPTAIVAAAIGAESDRMGTQFGEPSDVYEALFAGRRNLTTNGRHAIARIPMNTGHTLHNDPQVNWETLRAVSRGAQAAAQENQPLVAAGFCAPSEPVYDFFSISSLDGLLSIPEVNAPRGRITYPEIIDLPSLLPEVAIGGDYTAADDSNGVNKPVYTVNCGADRTFELTAHPTRVKFSNFDEMFHPERVSHVTGEVMATAAHNVNLSLISDIVAATDTTTVVNGDTGGGTWVEVVRALAWHSSYIRNHWRMPRNTVLDVIIPDWVISALVADQVARDSSIDYVFEVARIEAALRRINVNVQWVYDWQAPVNAGTFPTNFNFLMFPSGTVVKMRGMTLDLGVVRDSTLNTTNDFELFVETFEGIAIVGPAVFYVTGTEVCPTGATGVREAIACLAGS